MDSILVIHIGAGHHSKQNTKNYKKILRSALREKSLVESSQIIEKSSLTNTGYGSSIDRQCRATSDASLLLVEDFRINRSLALLDIHDDRFPTTCLLEVSEKLEKEFSVGSANQAFGLSKPTVLDYKTYAEYCAHSTKMGLCENSNLGRKLTSLVSAKAARVFSSFQAAFEEESRRIEKKNPDFGTSLHSEIQSPIPASKRLLMHEASDSPGEAVNVNKKRKRESDKVSSPNESRSLTSSCVEDTVGYIELSDPQTGKTQIATSSGGNFYRSPGRISCAGILGAGIGYDCHKEVEVSCMCSGNGDDIIAMNLASYLSTSIAETLGEFDEWPELGPLVESRILRKSRQVAKTAVNAAREEITYVGVIVVIRSPHSVRLVFCHSTETFYFAFRSQHGNLEVVFSRTDRPVGGFLYGEYKLA